MEAWIRLAGRILIVDRVLEALAPFRSRTSGVPSIAVGPTRSRSLHAIPSWRNSGSGSLGNWDLDYSTRFDPLPGYTIDLVPGLRLYVTADGTGVALDQPCAFPLGDPLIAQSILGPGLLLALALQGSYSLHAGAVARGGRAAVFLGDSGAGKSTLAAELDRRRARGWRRLADDVLPVTRAADGGIDALPEFPQLKLGPEEQYVADLSSPERLPVAAFYLLEMPAADEDAVTIATVSPRDATVALLAHTVASRLFAPDLAARHFAFCATAAGSVPVKRLRYPRRLQALDAVAEALAADLGI